MGVGAISNAIVGGSIIVGVGAIFNVIVGGSFIVGVGYIDCYSRW